MLEIPDDVRDDDTVAGMSRAVPAVGRALDILERFLDEERLPARYPRGRALPAMTPRSIASAPRRAALA